MPSLLFVSFQKHMTGLKARFGHLKQKVNGIKSACLKPLDVRRALPKAAPASLGWDSQLEPICLYLRSIVLPRGPGCVRYAAGPGGSLGSHGTVPTPCPLTHKSFLRLTDLLTTRNKALAQEQRLKMD